MLSPKRQKYRKMQKGRMKRLSQRGHRLSNGMFGIKSLDSKFITSRQIEAARIAATRYMKREGQLWIKIFPDKPITKKPLELVADLPPHMAHTWKTFEWSSKDFSDDPFSDFLE